MFANYMFATTSHAQTNPLHAYNMSDGSVFYNMSDNGKWAVAYGVSDATSTYSYPKLVDLTQHTVTELLSENEINAGIECYVNDVTDDGTIIAGCYDGQPAYYNTTTKKWTPLTLQSGNAGGRVEAITPDGKYAVGVCTNGGFDEVGTMWDVENNALVTLENLPHCDLSSGYQDMVRLTGISADGRYIVGCVSYSYPADVLYFLYDREQKAWDALAFDFSTLSLKFTPRDESVRTLDGICISPNGKWVAGVVYSVDDTRNPFRYNIETKVFENFNSPEDTDKGCVTIDNEGTIYAATPAVNPSRSLYIKNGKYWYGLDEILKQNYDIDYYAQTGYQMTGLAVSISSDCKSMVGMAYITHENYQVSLPITFAEACKNVNLLDNYNVSVRSGATIQKISNITLSFTRDVEVLASAQDICLRDEDGNLVRNALKIASESASAKNVVIGFRTTTLEKGKKYTIEIPAGAICIKGDNTQVNKSILLSYTGWGDEAITMTGVAPTNGSTLGHIDISTNPVIFEFATDVAVKDGAKALLYCNDEPNPTAELNILQGNTSLSFNKVLVHPTTTMNLYKDNHYRIVIPAGVLTDAAGYGSNAEAVVEYIGSYERTIVFDDTHLYIEKFENGMGNVMLYDGDNLQPNAEMQAWNFTSNLAWNYAADDDYTNTCATSHSMYTPAGKSNDWMVTPQLLIPDEKCVLTFDAQSYRLSANDRLKVMVIATEQAINELNSELIASFNNQGEWLFDEQLTPGTTENTLNGEWTSYAIDLAKYAGKKIYIAFVNQNDDQSAIFVTNIMVTHATDFLISLNGVPETVVAQSQQMVKGAVTIKDSEQTYGSIHVALLDNSRKVIDEISESGVSLTSGDTYNFAFQNPLQLTTGKECQFSIKVTLDNGASTQEMKASIKNLAFKPNKRILLEENTGQTCQNCPLGHLALEHMEQVYGDNFIPLAYHTYTGDNLESGMTDYALYFLGLNSAPTAIINRNGLVSAPMIRYVENGVVDFTFNSKDGDAWLDIANKEMAVNTEADINIGANYDEATGNVNIDYAINYAVDKSDNNVGLLCVITEDNITGYQRNTFSAETDEDLGEWGKGGQYGKGTVYPYIFNDVVRALYPANAYNGQTGLVPTDVEHSKKYTGRISLNLKQDAPYVSDINNCKVTCIMIDANTGAYINAARASMGETVAGVEAVTTTTTMLTASATQDGICVSTQCPTSIQVLDAQGRTLASTVVNGEATLTLNYNGIVFVKGTAMGNTTVVKVVR